MRDFYRVLSVLIICGVSHANAAAWIPIPNTSLEPEAGSALDLSHLADTRDPQDSSTVSIVNDQFFDSAHATQGLRFFSATLTFSPNNNGFPTFDESARLAVMIKRQGYNAVRVHNVESMLMHKRTADFDYDPVQLDRFYYLIAQLRAQGLYLFVDLLGSWNGAYGNVYQHRWTFGQYDLRIDTLLPGPARTHWLNLVKTLWAKVNPYTGVSTLQDPALAGVFLVNEGDTDFLFKFGSSTQLMQPFKTWLIAKYRSNNAFKAQAKMDITAINTLSDITKNAVVNKEFQRFTTELQVNQARWMKAELDKLMYRGPYSAFNTEPTYHNAATRVTLPFVDTHRYADHVQGELVAYGTQMASSNWPGRLLDGKNRFFDRLAWSRHFGQPYTVSEYGQPFWNKFRWEVAPFTAAYARLQNWSMISHYGNAFSLSRPAPGKWRAMITPYEVAIDPTLRAGETMAAFLFGRGDVIPSNAKMMMNLSSTEAAGLSNSQFVPWSLAQMQYILGVGLNIDNRGSDLENPTAEIGLTEENLTTSAAYAKLIKQGVISPDALTSIRDQRYLSETGELFIDMKNNRMSVITDGSITILGGAGSVVGVRVASIKIDEGEGAFMLADLSSDGGEANLATMRRGLLILSTESRNSNMSFLDAKETVLANIGQLPALLKSATVTLRLTKPNVGTKWRLFSLSFTGKRTSELPVIKDKKGDFVVSLNMAAVKAPISPYFELIAE